MCDLEVGPGAGDEVGDGEARLLAQPLAVAAHRPSPAACTSRPQPTSQAGASRDDAMPPAGRVTGSLLGGGLCGGRVAGRRRATPAARQHTDQMTRISAACGEAAACGGGGAGPADGPDQPSSCPAPPQAALPRPRARCPSRHATRAHCTSDSDGSRPLRQPPTRARCAGLRKPPQRAWRAAGQAPAVRGCARTEEAAVRQGARAGDVTCACGR